VVVDDTGRGVPVVVTSRPRQLGRQRGEEEIDRPRYDDVVVERHVERDQTLTVADTCSHYNDSNTS